MRPARTMGVSEALPLAKNSSSALSYSNSDVYLDASSEVDVAGFDVSS